MIDMMVAAFVVAAMVIALECRRMVGIYRRKACFAVVMSRIAMLVMLALFLFPPERQLQTPQSDKLKVVMGLDGSASMDVVSSGVSRRRSVEKALGEALEAEQELGAGRTQWFAFSDSLVPLQPGVGGSVSIPRMTGNTRLGDALTSLLAFSDSGTPLSAVVLFSDGRSNDGESPIDVARQYASRKIPISVVCPPYDDEALDVRIKVDSSTLKAVKYAPFDISAKVFLTGRDQVGPVAVQLISDGAVLDSKTVVPQRDRPASVVFTTQVPLAGFHTFALKVLPPSGDCRADNDIDYVSASVADAAVFKLLYLSYGVDWEWRYLNIHCERNKQLEASAVIQTAKDKFAFIGSIAESRKGDKAQGFPESSEELEAYDVIVANGELFSNLNDKQLSAIVSFVENKGGGLIVRGGAKEMPGAIMEMMPAKAIERQIVTRPVRLNVQPDLVYRRDTAKTLQTQKGLWCLPPDTVDVVKEGKSSTRSVVALGSQDGFPVMAVHAYGAGRVAFVGLNETWKWALENDETAKIYDAFWNHLIVWMAETGRPMVKIADDGAHLTVGEPHSFVVDVLGDDFKPAEDEHVTVQFTDASGQTSTVQMLPSLEEMGRYSVDAIPERHGECKMAVAVKGKNRTLTKTASFLACMNSREMDDMTINLSLLQDIARMTCGVFMTTDDYARKCRDIPFSPNVPMVVTTQRIIPRWALFLLLVLCAGVAWWMRRRLGLK